MHNFRNRGYRPAATPTGDWDDKTKLSPAQHFALQQLNNHVSSVKINRWSQKPQNTWNVHKTRLNWKQDHYSIDNIQYPYLMLSRKMVLNMWL